MFNRCLSVSFALECMTKNIAFIFLLLTYHNWGLLSTVDKVKLPSFLSWQCKQAVQLTVYNLTLSDRLAWWSFHGWPENNSEERMFSRNAVRGIKHEWKTDTYCQAYSMQRKCLNHKISRWSLRSHHKIEWKPVNCDFKWKKTMNRIAIWKHCPYGWELLQKYSLLQWGFVGHFGGSLSRLKLKS